MAAGAGTPVALSTTRAAPRVQFEITSKSLSGFLDVRLQGSTHAGLDVQRSCPDRSGDDVLLMNTFSHAQLIVSRDFGRLLGRLHREDGRSGEGRATDAQLPHDGL